MQVKAISAAASMVFLLLMGTYARGQEGGRPEGNSQLGSPFFRAATVDFWVERNGNPEDIMRGQGGSVNNILSVGLRLFALTTLDEQKHRRFLSIPSCRCP